MIFSFCVPCPITALLTPGTASNAPDDAADNADSAFPAEGMMNDDPGCYSDDDMGTGGGFPQSLASPAKKSATEVGMQSVHSSAKFSAVLLILLCPSVG